MRKNRFSSGFTMLEFAVVITISGILMIAAIRAYLVYEQDAKYLANMTKINSIQTGLNLYANNPAKGRYPCPADPSLPVNDPNAGMEVCLTVPGFPAIGSCNTAGWPYPNSKAGSICHLYGARKTVTNVTANNDPIVIGGIPFKTISGGSNTQNAAQISMTDSQDPWGYQYTYAVTDSETSKADSTMGAIDVQSETGVELLLPAKSAVFVVVGHGQDHNGAYNTAGKITVPCGALAAAKDNYNCSYGNIFVSALRADAPGVNHFDDILAYSSGYINMLWDFVGGPNDDIHNVNVGRVGVGTLQAQPVAALELKNNDLYVTPNNVCDLSGNCWRPAPDVPKVCDLNSKCFQPEWLGGYDASDVSNPDNPAAYTNMLPSGNQCGPTGTSKVNVVYGMNQGQVVCSAVGDVNHPPITPLVLPLNHHCPGADDSPATTPQYYVTEITSTGVRCCDIGGNPEPGFATCQIH